MTQFKFIWKSAIVFAVAFIAFTIIGTQTHELGHIAIAKALGYDTTLSYGSMNYFPKGYLNDVDYLELEEIHKKYKMQLRNGESFAKKERMKLLHSRLSKRYPVKESASLNSFLVGLGGPSQTILTSILGLFILWYRKTKYRESFKILDWLAVFLALFILREVYNTFMAGIAHVLEGKSNFHGDEFGISRYFGMNEWVVPIITAIIGLMISLYVIFKIIPLRYRFTFIISGLVGGILGFILWFEYLGPWLFM